MKKLALVFCVILLICNLIAMAESTSIWEKRNYVDEFNMPIDEEYYVCIAEGTFSNSATTNSELLAPIFYDPNENRIWFKLYEYGNHKVTAYKNTNYYFIMMDDSGNKYEWYSAYMWEDTDYIAFDKKGSEETIYNNILTALKSGGTVRFALQKADGITAKYVFSIQDEAGLAGILEVN